MSKTKLALLILSLILVIGIILYFNSPQINYWRGTQKIAKLESIEEVVITNSDLNGSQIRLTNQEDFRSIVNYLREYQSEYKSSKRARALRPAGGWSKRISFNFKDGSYSDVFLGKDYIRIGRYTYILPSNDLNSMLDNMSWE